MTQIIYATDFGAAFDNVTDDTAAIQAALDAAVYPNYLGANPNDWPCAIVEMPPGRAKITAALKLPANVWLRGHGPSTTYLQHNSTPNINAIELKTGIETQVTLSDFGIIGAGAASSQGAGVWLNKTGGASILDSRFVLRDLCVVSTYRGVWIPPGATETRLVRITTQRTRYKGFEVATTDCFISDCTAAEPGHHGFEIGGANQRVWGCKVFGGGGGAGFAFGGSGRMQVTACEVQDYNGNGFNVTRDCVLAACLADSVSGVGFNLDTMPADGPSQLVGCEAIKREGGLYTPTAGFRVVGSNRQVIQGRTHGCAKHLQLQFRPECSFQINNDHGIQTVAYAPSITPDPFAGGTVKIAAAGNLTIQNPVSNNGWDRSTFYPGQRLAFEITASAACAVTFGNTYKLRSAVSLQPNEWATVEFRYDWDASQWVQV